MADLGFALRLGSGLYMDSDGALHTVPPPGVPVYKPPWALPFDPAKFKGVLDAVNGALKGTNKDPQLLLQFHIWGAKTTLLDILSGIGKVAGALAPLLGALSAAIELLKIMGILKDGPSALEQLVTARFNDLQQNVHAIGQMITTRDLRNGRIAIETFSAAVKTFVAQQDQLTLQQYLDGQLTLAATHGDRAAGIAALLDQQTWNSDFLRSEHKTVWPALQGLLFTMPGGPGDAPAPAPLPADGSLFFDHRLMVPLASFAAESYLACIRGLAPEYRSSGDFRDTVRSFAGKLDGLAQAMRAQVLARTVYTAAHFTPIVPYYDVEASWPPGAFGVSPRCSRWPVGAFDLRYHDDAFFAQFFKDLAYAEATGTPAVAKLAGMDMRWRPPANLVPAEYGNYRISNPEECAAAANAQAESDYAMLLALSGYPELLRLAALFRNEAVEPLVSQTVSPGAPWLARYTQASSTVTVHSRPVFLTGQVITATARREPAQCMATVAITTQPVKRALPAQYKVTFRTLRSIYADSYQAPAYSDYQRVGYEPDPANLDFLRLSIATTMLEAGAQAIIAEWTSSPRGEAVHREGTATLAADTFDWWVPVKHPFSVDSAAHISLSELHQWGKLAAQYAPKLPPPPGGIGRGGTPTGGAGGTADGAGGGATSAGVAGASSLAGEIVHRGYIPQLTRPGDFDSLNAQPREMQRKTVHVEYVLDWTGQRLDISTKGDPADRSYLVYAVVEEQLTGSTKVLHTAVGLPINGLITYVPEQFFVDEAMAHAKTARSIYDLLGRVIPGVDDIGPPGPPEWVRPGDLASRVAMQRIVDFAREHRPALFRLMLQNVDVDKREGGATSSTSAPTAAHERPAAEDG